MRLRIYYDDYMSLMKEIRDRVEMGEWQTWTVDTINVQGKKIRRLVHSPKGDDQYRSIQIRLCVPSRDDIKNNEKYLDMIPASKNDVELSNDEFFHKSAVVLGRWCEILNCYFPKISEYHVYLKD